MLQRIHHVAGGGPHEAVPGLCSHRPPGPFPGVLAVQWPCPTDILVVDGQRRLCSPHDCPRRIPLHEV